MTPAELTALTQQVEAQLDESLAVVAHLADRAKWVEQHVASALQAILDKLAAPVGADQAAIDQLTARIRASNQALADEVTRILTSGAVAPLPTTSTPLGG